MSLINMRSYRIGLAAAIGISALIYTMPAQAQVDGAITYDSANNAYFVTGDASVTGNISGNDIFVGKDNATDFNTLTGSFTFTVGDSAYITYFGNNYPGRYYFSLNTFGNHTTNIGGGFVSYAIGFDNSTTNITGGYASYATSWDSSTMNISGGAVYTVTGTTNSTVNISGGEIENTDGYDSAILNMSSGLVQKVTLSNDSLMTITGGTITTSLAVGDKSTLNLSGNFTTQVGDLHGSYDRYTANGTNYLARDYTVTGNLADGTTFEHTITAAANTVSLGTNNLQFRGNTTDIAPDRYVTSNESVTGVYNNVVVGKNSNGTVSTSPTADLNTDTGHLDTYNNSQVILNSGVVHGELNTHDNSTVHINGSTIQDLYAHDNSTTNINNSNIENIEGDQSAIINVLGGNIDYVSLQDTNQSTVSGGTIYSFDTSGSSHIALSDGSITHLYMSDNSLLNMTGGSVDDLSVYHGSTANISGGSVNSLFNLYSTTNIFGGDINDFAAAFGVVNISGGTINSKTLRLFGDETSLPLTELNLFGAGLSFALIGEGSDLDGFYTGYSLFGTLQDGQSVDGYSVYDYTRLGSWSGGGSTLSFATGAVVVPEPSALSLMGMMLSAGIGIVIVRRRVIKGR